MGSGGQNDSNTHQFARISEKKYLMNATYIMSRKWESNVFGLRGGEMTLTPINLLESARKIFFINSTYIMSRKWESNVFGLTRPK